MKLHNRKKFILERGAIYCKLFQPRIASLRSQVSDSSHLYPFYLYFNWRKMNEETYYQLCTLIGFLKTVPHLFQDPVEQHILRELFEQFDKIHDRFAECKFSAIFHNFSVNPAQTMKFKSELFPPIRELKGNYLRDSIKGIEGIYSLRHHTPKRVKRMERIRGYRDHGSLPADPGRKKCEQEIIYQLPEEYISLVRRTSTDPRRAIKRLNLFKE